MKLNLFIKQKKFFRRLLITSSVCLGLIIILLLGLTVWAQLDYNQVVNHAQQRFHKSKAESLLAALESESYSLHEKNRVIGALGILKDKTTLNKLESLRTFKPCDGISVCQYELNKAILKIKGEYKHEYFSSWIIK